MPSVTDKKRHHCPGNSGGSIGSKKDELFGNCRYSKTPRYCTRHQMLCLNHPDWAHMRHRQCELCEEAERAREREFKAGKKVLVGSQNKMRSTTNTAKAIKKIDRGAEARMKTKVEIVAQWLELFDVENTPHKPLPLLEFDERKERAAKVIERQGWDQIRNQLVQAGVGESSLPMVSPTGSPVI